VAFTAYFFTPRNSWGFFFVSRTPRDAAQRVGFAPACPDAERREGLREPFGQVDHAGPFRRVMSRDDQRDVAGVGFQGTVKSRLAGQEDVGTGGGGIWN
jgi:hypothetical protein